ncbi:hypothetical protein VB10N_12990 [Vibrio sp. 10N]|nr:hypothetical protein VB10N_12990 [Vibrio sp. 10N]
MILTLRRLSVAYHSWHQSILYTVTSGAELVYISRNLYEDYSVIPTINIRRIDFLWNLTRYTIFNIQTM